MLVIGYLYFPHIIIVDHEHIQFTPFYNRVQSLGAGKHSLPVGHHELPVAKVSARLKEAQQRQFSSPEVGRSVDNPKV